MNRQERRKLQRQANPMEVGQIVLQKALQTFYDVMRDNRISDDRAEKILNETIERMGRNDKNDIQGISKVSTKNQ